MMNKQKNNKFLFGSMAIVGLVVMILSVGVIVKAQNNAGFQELLAKYLAVELKDDVVDALGINDDIIDNEISIGAIATSTDLTASAFTSLRLYPNEQSEPPFIRFDMGSRSSEGISQSWEIVDFASASTTIFSIENTTGETVYITDARIKLTGLPTSTLQMFIGTSTTSYVNNDTYQAITDPSDSITSIMDNILVTDGNVLDATSTVFSLLDFPGSDTGNGNYGVPVLAGEYVVGYASTTDGDNDRIEITAGYFDGTAYLEWEKLD